MITLENLKKWAEVQETMSGQKISDEYLRVMFALSNKDYTIGKDVEFFSKGERAERLLVDPVVVALITDRMERKQYTDCSMVRTLKEEWKLNDPFITLQNDTITTDVAGEKPYILDITDIDEDDFHIVFQAFGGITDTIKQAKNILTDTRFKGQIMEINGVPTLGLHILGKDIVTKGNTDEVNVWESMEYDLDIALWMIALFEKLPTEKQTLANFIKISRKQPITLKEFGQLLVA